MSRQPFYSRDYQKGKGRLDPLVEVKIVLNGKNKTLESYADTGCISGLAITKKQMAKEALDFGEKINDEPIRYALADGRIVCADHYMVDIEVGGETKKVRIAVVDPEIKLGVAKEEPDVAVLLGRGFFDNFDVEFLGINKRIAFFKSAKI